MALFLLIEEGKALVFISCQFIDVKCQYPLLSIMTHPVGKNQGRHVRVAKAFPFLLLVKDTSCLKRGREKKGVRACVLRAS